MFILCYEWTFTLMFSLAMRDATVIDLYAVYL